MVILVSFNESDGIFLMGGAPIISIFKFDMALGCVLVTPLALPVLMLRKHEMHALYWLPKFLGITELAN
jgi:hypothetical protein